MQTTERLPPWMKEGMETYGCLTRRQAVYALAMIRAAENPHPRRTLEAGIRLTLLLAALALGPPLEGQAASAGTEREAIFEDAAPRVGLDFLHFNGMSGELYFPEMMGAGVALFDADNDGDLDRYLAAARLEPARRELATLDARSIERPGSRD